MNSLTRTPAVSQDAGDTIFYEYFPQTGPVNPNTELANPVAPTEKRRVETSTGFLFLGSLTCLLKDLSLTSIWTFG